MTTQPATEDTSGEKPKLSALIRKGAEMVGGHQWRGDYIGHNNDGEVCLCALGAAYYALKSRLPSSRNWYTEDILSAAIGYSTTKVEFVVIMNDVEEKTFDEIAAALEARGL